VAEVGLQRAPIVAVDEDFDVAAILFNPLCRSICLTLHDSSGDAARFRADLGDLEVIFLARFAAARTLQRPVVGRKL